MLKIICALTIFIVHSNVNSSSLNELIGNLPNQTQSIALGTATVALAYLGFTLYKSFKTNSAPIPISLKNYGYNTDRVVAGFNPTLNPTPLLNKKIVKNKLKKKVANGCNYCFKERWNTSLYNLSCGHQIHTTCHTKALPFKSLERCPICFSLVKHRIQINDDLS